MPTGSMKGGGGPCSSALQRLEDLVGVVPSTTCWRITKCGTVLSAFLNRNVPLAGRVLEPPHAGPALATILPSTSGAGAFSTAPLP